MFLRILGGFVVLLALLWAVAFAAATAELRREQAEPWPFGLGSIKEANARTAAVKSPMSEQITALINALDLDGVTPEETVAEQVAKHNDAIDAIPQEAGLAGNEAAVPPLVHALLNAGTRAVCGTDTPYTVEDAVELLAVAALDRARNGDAAAAWDDLHAMWILTRSLHRDSFIVKDTVLKLERDANAVARMLPAPAPPWAAELASIDARRDTAASIQEESTIGLNSGKAVRGRLGVLGWLFEPINMHYNASQARHSRLAAATMTSSPRCRIDVAALGAAEHGAPIDRTTEIYRAARIEAELDATAKILALKNERARLGRWPPALPDGGASRCDSNRWIYEVKPDLSSMKLRMSWEVAAEPDARSAPALRFAY